MSAGLVDLIVVLAVGVIVVRRRSVAIYLLAAQSLALGICALSVRGELSGGELATAIVLLGKAAVLPLLLYVLMRRTREARPVLAANGPLIRLAAACVLALVAGWLTPSLGLGDIHAQRAAVAVVLVGIAIVVARRPILFQLIGMIVAENGVSLLAISARGGLSYVVEVGALFDLAVIVAVAAAFTTRIHDELGTGNTELLRGLRD
jgi:hydrogenase-4 component E